jgi:5-methylcytosine-specific restriction endonuclease McrA
MKICSKCNKIYPHSEEYFNIDSQKIDGLYPSCKACVKLYCRDYYIRNRKRKLLINKRWNNLHPERRYLHKRKWNRKNKSYKRILDINNRAKRLQAEGSFTIKEWNELCEYYGNKCLCCGSKEITIDHIVPIVSGGINDISNLQPLCGKCNSSKGTKIIDYRKKGEHFEQRG